jgi:3-phenylpropionate/trans-cinnamate dioxygenase ferredoxin reductase component
VSRKIVIVGASAAGLTTAEALRRRGFDGLLTLIGDEVHLPYDRPPLSKQLLAGSWENSMVMLRKEQDLAALDAEFILGQAATGLDVEGRRVLLDDDKDVTYDDLVIATGVTARTLPGAELAGTYLLRTLDDTIAIRDHLDQKPKVVIIGAGFQGAEIAATARGKGLDVTLVDPLPVPMHRQLGDQMGGLIGQLHRDHGVTVRCGTGISQFLGDKGRVTGVELANGTVLEAGLVVIAIGSRPATGWLGGSGLSIDNGVECDECCQAGPGIYAAGDVASWFNPLFGTRMRLEHRMNATEQAIAVAGNLLGDNKPFAPVPYFWTDQYDLKIQAYGVFPAGAEVQLISGTLEERHFTVAYGYGGVVSGVLAWNSPREIRVMRQLVVQRAPFPTSKSLAGTAAMASLGRRCS